MRFASRIEREKHMDVTQGSRRSAAIRQSEIRRMTLACTKRRGINLAQGVADLALPDIVGEGGRRAIADGENSYTRFDGIDALRRGIAKKLALYNGIAADPDKEIIVTSGATGAFYVACMSLLNPGDACILFQPFYSYHADTLAAADATPVFATLTAPDWQLDMGALEALVTPATKAIMINTPANPCGKVFTREELEALADFSVRHDLIVFTDEIYEYYLYDGSRHISPASIAAIQDRTVTISGYSKTFNITGWRIGYLACNPDWAAIIGHLNDLIYVCAPAPLQHGVARGLDGLPAEFYENIGRTYQGKRDLVCSALLRAGLTPHVPSGAYYVLADVSSVPGTSATEKAMHILEKTGVASVPGSAFYNSEDGGNLVRFCFAKSDDTLNLACGRLQRL